jgi:hypothetical protein
VPTRTTQIFDRRGSRHALHMHRKDKDVAMTQRVRYLGANVDIQEF